MRKDSQLKSAWQQFLSSEIDDFPQRNWCDVTLSLKPSLVSTCGGKQKLNRNEVSKFVRELLKRLNKAFYKHAYQRYHKKLACVPVIEQQASGRLHVHMLLEIPDYLGTNPHKNAFCRSVETTAKQLVWCEKGNNAQHLVRVIPDNTHAKNWLDYILKDIGKDADVVDAININI